MTFHLFFFFFFPSENSVLKLHLIFTRVWVLCLWKCYWRSFYCVQTLLSLDWILNCLNYLCHLFCKGVWLWCSHAVFFYMVMWYLLNLDMKFEFTENWFWFICGKLSSLRTMTLLEIIYANNLMFKGPERCIFFFWSVDVDCNVYEQDVGIQFWNLGWDLIWEKCCWNSVWKYCENVGLKVMNLIQMWF